MLSNGSRIFVGIVFAILGASFIATTAVMIDEFRALDWFSLAVFYSHLFVFFPTFGLVALAAFYIPACVFTDMYWKHVVYGRTRYVVGFALLAALSYGISYKLLQGEERTLWEVTPDTLSADKGAPAGCNADAQSCRRLPVLQALSSLREISQGRVGLSEFGRNCKPDKLLEFPDELLAKRHCFVTNTSLDAAACCKAQAGFGQFMTDSYAPVENRSRTGWVHNTLLPLKVFFLLVLLVVGGLLAVRRKGIDLYYSKISSRIETGVLTGVAVMLFWPVMNHAFLQSAAVLYGTDGDSLFRFLGPAFSAAFGAWGLLLLLFFFRRYGGSIEQVGKIGGLIASAVAILQYDKIVDYSVWIAGSGSNHLTMSVLMLIGFLALAQLAMRMWSSDGSGFGEDRLAEDVASTRTTSGGPAPPGSG